MNLDTVTTIAIGDIDADGNRLSQACWDHIRARVRRLAECDGTVVATAKGAGVTSDQPEEASERTYVVVVVNAATTRLRRDVAALLAVHNLSSACFATDRNHEPAFPTFDGYRPPAEDPEPTAAEYYPTHGGYPSC